jgi:hypothetical protein
MPAVPIAEGKSEATVTFEVQAQVPFTKDPKTATKPNTLVTLPSRPVTLVVRPAAKK